MRRFSAILAAVLVSLVGNPAFASYRQWTQSIGGDGSDGPGQITSNTTEAFVADRQYSIYQISNGVSHTIHSGTLFKVAGPINILGTLNVVPEIPGGTGGTFQGQPGSGVAPGGYGVTAGTNNGGGGGGGGCAGVGGGGGASGTCQPGLGGPVVPLTRGLTGSGGGGGAGASGNTQFFALLPGAPGTNLNGAQGGNGGNGGGNVMLIAGDAVTIGSTGTVNAVGNPGLSGTGGGGGLGGGGGGSGGVVSILSAVSINHQGVINVNGGNGGDGTTYTTFTPISIIEWFGIVGHSRHTTVTRYIGTANDGGGGGGGGGGYFFYQAPSVTLSGGVNVTGGSSGKGAINNDHYVEDGDDGQTFGIASRPSLPGILAEQNSMPVLLGIAQLQTAGKFYPGMSGNDNHEWIWGEEEGDRLLAAVCPMPGTFDEKLEAVKEQKIEEKTAEITVGEFTKRIGVGDAVHLVPAA